jgi:hypothetical protein
MLIYYYIFQNFSLLCCDKNISHDDFSLLDVFKIFLKIYQRCINKRNKIWIPRSPLNPSLPGKPGFPGSPSIPLSPVKPGRPLSPGVPCTKLSGTLPGNPGSPCDKKDLPISYSTISSWFKL